MCYSRWEALNKKNDLKYLHCFFLSLLCGGNLDVKENKLLSFDAVFSYEQIYTLLIKEQCYSNNNIEMPIN